MKRRQILIGLGAVAGSGTLLGSGAFSSTEADRSVSVTVAQESNAYLGMEPTTNSANTNFTRTDNNTGEVAFDFNGDPANGSGVGKDSVYQFDRVFQVTNQGTQTVYLEITVNDDPNGSSSIDANNVYAYVADNRGTPIDGSDAAVELETGETAEIGFHIDSEGASISSGGGEELLATIVASDSSSATTLYDESGNTV